MSECLVYGLYVLFNSTIYDEYYRILNGSTQVNSTEINNMPVPELETIQEMGRKLIKTRDFSEKGCDLILEDIMDKISETREFLKNIGMPKQQQADICCYVILAMAGIKPEMPWNEATNEWIRIHDIIQFANTYYGTSYAENSRETFRKQALHRFRTAALVEDNGKATNSPNYRYRLTDETLQLIRNLDTNEWNKHLKLFLTYHEKLVDIYASKKKMTMMPVKLMETILAFQLASIMNCKRQLLKILHQDLLLTQNVYMLEIQ